MRSSNPRNPNRALGLLVLALFIAILVAPPSRPTEARPVELACDEACAQFCTNKGVSAFYVCAEFGGSPAGCAVERTTVRCECIQTRNCGPCPEAECVSQRARK